MTGYFQFTVCVAALIPYFTNCFGYELNSVTLFSTLLTFFLSWRYVLYKRSVRWVFIILLLALAHGILANGLIPAIRSFTSYLGLLILVSFQNKGRVGSLSLSSRNLTLLYFFGLLQILLYFVKISINQDYSFIRSLNEQSRTSIGWISIICFSHTTFPTIKNAVASKFVTRTKYVFWTVPILVYFNSSRTELIIVILLILSTLLIRRSLWGTLFLCTITIFTVPTSNTMLVVQRFANFLPELYRSDLNLALEAHSHYRSFENMCVVEKIVESPITGCGLGCAVPLPMTMVINQRNYDDITVGHNGYLMVILHFGIIGALILIYFGYMFINILANLLNDLKSKNILSHCFTQSNIFQFSVFMVVFISSITQGGIVSAKDVLQLIIPLSCSVKIGNDRLHRT